MGIKSTVGGQFIVEFLQGKDWTSPTDIGIAYGIYKHGMHHHKSGYHSAWASPKCLKMLDAGLLERDQRGWYRLAGHGG